MRDIHVYQSISDLKKCFFINNLKNRTVVNIKNIDYNNIIEIRIVFIFQRKLKTIERSRMLLTKCIKINNSLKYLTVIEIVVISFFQYTNEFIN